MTLSFRVTGNVVVAVVVLPLTRLSPIVVSCFTSFDRDHVEWD
jgi:hypothetical protein